MRSLYVRDRDGNIARRGEGLGFLGVAGNGVCEPSRCLTQLTRLCFYHIRFMVHYFLHSPANKYRQAFPTFSGIDKSKALHHVLRESYQHPASSIQLPASRLQLFRSSRQPLPRHLVLPRNPDTFSPNLHAPREQRCRCHSDERRRVVSL